MFHTVSVTNKLTLERLVDLLQRSTHIRPLLRRLVWSMLESASDSATTLANPAPELFPLVEHLVHKHCGLIFFLLASMHSLTVPRRPGC
jgi:hypothetical protein